MEDLGFFRGGGVFYVGDWVVRWLGGWVVRWREGGGG